MHICGSDGPPLAVHHSGSIQVPDMPNQPATCPSPIDCVVSREPVVERIRGQGHRVHIPIGAVCNNNCLFCMEEDREARKRINGEMRGDRVRWVLESNRGADEVCFTSGEPTMHPELALLVREARELGYERISLMTNGRRLAYPGFASQLVRAGLNRLYLSIHGHNAELHDSLTRTPGSFAQTLAGLHIAATFRSRGVSLHTSTVLTTRNATVQLEIYEMLVQAGVDQAVFNALQVTGRAARFVDRIVPRYEQVRSGFDRLVRNAADGGARAFLVDVPLCVTHGLPENSRGWVERHVHYESDGRKANPLGIGAEGGMRRIHTSDLDDAFRSFAPGCVRCAYRPVCPGVYTAYAAHHGWAEFQPVPIVERA